MSPLAPYAYGAAGLLVIGVSATGYFAVRSYKSMAEKVATAEARIGAAEKEAKELREAHNALSSEFIQRAAFDNAIRTARAETARRIDKVIHEDPVARAWGSEPLPDSVRQAVLGPAER